MLIARPAALFGDHGATTIPSNADKVTASDRMKAVVYVNQESFKVWPLLTIPLHAGYR